MIYEHLLLDSCSVYMIRVVSSTGLYPFGQIKQGTNALPSLSSSEMRVLTKEEFNAYHKMTEIYSLSLVFDLNRDMNQSFQVIGFLFLLEQNGYARNLISYLVSLPVESTDAVANEIVVCLSFLYNKDFFGVNNNYDQSVIPLLISLTKYKLSLDIINQNRESFLHGLRMNISQICKLAFEDLYEKAERYNKEKMLALEREKAIEEFKKIRLSVQQPTTNKTEVVVEETVEEEEIAPEDRTVFLTFSEGYPVSKERVRIFFTRKCGEVIEAVKMQDVKENEQPLYARMVLKMRYVSKMEEIVCGRNRNKFCIDGKDVWDRKYVPRTYSKCSVGEANKWR